MWKKVVAPTALVCLLWVLVSGTTTFGIYELSRSHSSILTDNVASIRTAGSMQASLWQLQVALLDVTEEEMGAVAPEFVELEAQFERSLFDSERAATTPPEQELIKSIRERFSEYRDFIHLSLQRREADVATRAAVADKSAQLARTVAEPCIELVRINERLMTDSLTRAAQIERALYLVRFAFLIAGPGVGVYLGLRISRNMQSSISQISVTLNDVTGKLDQEIGCVEIVPTGDPDELAGLNQQVQVISTRIRQVVSELHEARQEAEITERLAVVGELAAGVAHELRNPLTSVKLLIQTAPKNDLGIHLQQKQAQVILEEILRMEATIQGLLDFARPPHLHRVRHDLRETVRRALNLVEGRAIHEDVAVVSLFPSNPLTVDADPAQLQQVFANLLINGIESMQHSGTLDVTAGLSARDPHLCQITVTDKGHGIPEDRLGRIFEPFVTTKERGTGLGLAVSRRIIQEHGGSITASNRPEGGAEFTVELPLARPAALPESNANVATALPVLQRVNDVQIARH